MMPGLLELCEQYFESKDLYSVLRVKKEATPNELRKGYLSVSLTVHPDRVQSDNKEEATKRFQTLSRVYQLLSDQDLRAVYDESGEVDEENASSECKDWDTYWRGQFTKITVQNIVKFEKEYVGSAEELADLETEYVSGKGSMDHILKNVLVCSIDDEDRFRTIIDKWIKEGKVEGYEAYVKETARSKKQRKRRAGKEAKEAEEAKKELGLGDDDADLTAMIQARCKSRKAESDSFLDSLAAKYSKPAKRAKKPKN